MVLKIVAIGFFLSFAVGQLLQAQEGVSVISGRVTDEAQTPIAFANIVIRDTLNSLVTGSISDATGVFRLHVGKTDPFVLEVHFMGYRTYQKHITIAKGNTLDVGTLILSADEHMLSEVKVVKDKPLIEQWIDRLVFHVENSVAASNGDALDVLSATPGVVVRADRISLIG